MIARVGTFAGRTLTFGTSERATVRAYDIEHLGIDGMRARMVTPMGERQVQTPLIGGGNLANVLAATAVALDLGTPLDDIAGAASRLKTADRRGAVRRLRGRTILIDDSYNSSPSALAAALDVVASETRTSRKVAVLGEMLELGEHSLALHRQSGRMAAAAGLRLLFAIGGEPARALAAAAIEAGMPVSAVRYAEESELAARAVVCRRSPGRSRARQRVSQHPNRYRGGRRRGGVCLMLYSLLPDLAPLIGILNVTRYITFRTAAASLTALAISLPPAARG